MMLISVVLTLQENIIPPRLHKNTIDYNNTVSLLSFHKMQPDYIYIVNKIYILLLITATGIICLLGIKFMRVWMFFVQEEKLRGVSVWNVRETGGQESQLSRS